MHKTTQQAKEQVCTAETASHENTVPQNDKTGRIEPGKSTQPKLLSVDERYSEIVKSIHRWFGEEDEE